MEKGTECVGGWIQIRMKCPKRGHVRRNNDEIELRKWQSKRNVLLFIHDFRDFMVSKELIFSRNRIICTAGFRVNIRLGSFTFEFRNTS